MLTPKGYLSWSQLDLIEVSPERYREAYINGHRPPPNRGQRLGSKIHEAMENESLTGEISLDMVIEKVPRLECREEIVMSEMECGYKIPLLIKMDTFKKDLSAFKDYKTGLTRWTQERVDKDDQITFYATAIWLKTKKIPEDIELVDIATKYGPDGNPEATGEVYRFKTRRTMADIVRMMARIKKGWEKIEKMCVEEFL
jgi:hypothetical protein